MPTHPLISGENALAQARDVRAASIRKQGDDDLARHISQGLETPRGLT